MSKPLAKSLHTVSVLVNVAKLVKAEILPPDYTDEECLRYALKALKLDGMPDQYGLVQVALRQLQKRV